MNPQHSVQFGHRQQIVIWVAMVCSVVMCFVLAGVLPPPEPAVNPTLVGACTLLACALTGVSFLVKSRFQERAREATRPGLLRLGYLLALVLCEAAALQGLLIRFLTGSPRYVWPMIIGLTGLLLHRPERND